MNTFFFGSQKRGGSANSVKMRSPTQPANQFTSGGQNERGEEASPFFVSRKLMDLYIKD
jgi:hypothetical protein